MKKRQLLLTGICTLLLASTVFADGTTQAVKNNMNILVNGKKVAFDAYTIDGNNYLKLRDVAAALNGTKGQFNIGFENSTIKLLSGATYQATGEELKQSNGPSSVNASASETKIAVGDDLVDLKAYNIGGFNYFKLRDLGEALDFDVDFDATTSTVLIETDNDDKDDKDDKNDKNDRDDKNDKNDRDDKNDKNDRDDKNDKDDKDDKNDIDD